MEKKISEILMDILEVKSDNISSDLSEWDSLAHLNVILALEEEFKVKIPPEDFSLLHSDISSIKNYIEKKLQ